MHQLFKPINNASLAAFRILFGLLIATELRWEWAARVELVQQRPIRFPYLGFEWLALLPTGWGEPFLYSLAACCLLISLGLCFRPAAIAFTVGYTWMFLLDRAYFNNHNYLICMLGGWLAVSDAHRRWSVDAWLRPAIRTSTVPTWQLAGIIGQIGVAYFFGGVAKINPDWLRGEPMGHFLNELAGIPVFEVFAHKPWLAVPFAWGGLLFDLFITPALLWRRTRLLAIAAMAFFHVMNANMFTIGIFPWLSMASIVLFLPPASVEHVFGLLRRMVAVTALQPVISDTPPLPQNTGRFIATGFILWFAFQCLLPLRSLLLPGPVGWTREGFYFAWTMKLDAKSTFLGFHVCDSQSGDCRSIDHNADLTPVQANWLPYEPRGIAQYARFLRRREEQTTARPVTIVCDSVAALNGRPHQYMIDPTVDVAVAPLPTFGHADWIVPLDRDAPIGNYVTATVKTKRAMRLIQEVRIVRGLFPQELQGQPIRDLTAAERTGESR